MTWNIKKTIMKKGMMMGKIHHPPHEKVSGPMDNLLS